MCTALTYYHGDHYFGRNLDLEYTFQEAVVITPRNYPFQFYGGQKVINHHAMIGIAYVVKDHPLYYDAMNEKGLSVAGLNFPGNAVYHCPEKDKADVASFELIPLLLSQCATVKEAVSLLENAVITNRSFNQQMPATPLHWLIGDQNEAVTVESVKEGLEIHDNPVGVLTNNPPFEYHMLHLSEFMNVSSSEAVNRFADGFALKPFSRGMGGKGLPGDMSSSSRFVRAAFAKWNSICNATENENVSQFFHILGSVEMLKGCVRLENDHLDITQYSSCCNMDRGIYYYRTYNNSQITAVDMHCEDLDGDRLIQYPLICETQFHFQNKKESD